MYVFLHVLVCTYSHKYIQTQHDLSFIFGTFIRELARAQLSLTLSFSLSLSRSLSLTQTYMCTPSYFLSVYVSF